MAANKFIKQIYDHPLFNKVVNYVIVACSLIVGLETILIGKYWQLFFHYLDYVFLAFFTAEIFIRIAAERHPLLFFMLFKRIKKEENGKIKYQIKFTEHGFWNIFDLFLISTSFIGAFTHLFSHANFIEIGRLFRIFRIVRLLEISDQLKEIERRIVSIVPTVFSFALLLIILIYIYSILGMYLFENRIFDKCNFSNIIESSLSLFQVMTLDGWSDVMNDIKTSCTNLHPFIVQAYFVSFVVFTAIVTFNVFIAIMTSKVEDKMERDFQIQEDHIQEIAQEAIDVEKQMHQSVLTILKEITDLKKEIGELKAKIK